MTDFSDPEQRLDYLLQHGIDAYNKAMEDHFAKVVETVNGHPIRLVHTMRSARSTWSTASTAATRPWTAPDRSREVKRDRADPVPVCWRWRIHPCAFRRGPPQSPSARETHQ
jgi:hypothetical protein